MSLIYECELRDQLRKGDGEGLLPRDDAWFLASKSAADAILASVLLVLASPLILLLMILTRATSRGPAIFEQVRTGRDGREYRLYKIRSMANDCERLTGPKWSTTDDPRVTPLGRFLRRTHLDELPQLWNVIRGEMSLVGPRPERPEFIAKLEREVPRYRERLAVKPGITGLAQVLLPPDQELDDVRRKVICDLCYIRQMGPWLDLRILVVTALKVVGLPYEITRKAFELSMFAEPAMTFDVAPAHPGEFPVVVAGHDPVAPVVGSRI
jgi:lipopolysaccharide/colanic/teichoic acid biosynthesis glycosyltransferase